MAKLVIQTQYMENYDVDEVSEDGYWKFKGGHDYIIDNVDVNNVQSVVAEITPLIEYDNSMSREYILEWTVESDDWVPYTRNNKKNGMMVACIMSQDSFRMKMVIGLRFVNMRKNVVVTNTTII